jgi:hypothetical protein
MSGMPKVERDLAAFVAYPNNNSLKKKYLKLTEN